MHAAQTEPEMEGLQSSFLRRKPLEKAVKWLAGNSMLDLGCGKGEFLSMMGKGGNMGVDINPDFVGLAQHRFPQPDFRILSLDGSEYPNTVKSWKGWASNQGCGLPGTIGACLS